jgi:sugar fermentation stimulation protein A
VRHLAELVALREQGHRAVLLFSVNRTDAESVEPADDIDPAYGRALREAIARGVEVLGYRVGVTPTEVTVEARVPVRT